MTTILWPEELPRPERETWQSAPADARTPRQGDTGPGGYRLMFSSVPTLVKLSVRLSRNEKEIFDRFHRVDTKRGSLFFSMPDPTTDGWQLLTKKMGVPLETMTGQPLLIARRWLCTFGSDMPTETIVGIEFRKSFSVAVMP